MNTAIDDLRSDLLELLGLCDSAIERLTGHIAAMRQKTGAYMPATAEYLLGQADNLLVQYTTLRAEVQKQMSEEAELLLVERKYEFQDRLRVLQSFLGSALSAGNWQSPSVRHTRYSQAGNETGAIRTYENDYKRDRHLDERSYARQFVREYIDHPGRLAPAACLTGSGMAAVLMTLSYLHKNISPNATVLAGTSTYFQSKWVLESLFPGRLQYVAENDTRQILHMARTLRPSIVFFDTISNNAHTRIDAAVLLKELPKVLAREATIILDNTGLSIMYQPLRDYPIRPFGPDLFVVESLSKYHQFGLDRNNGGIVWSPLGASFSMFKAAHSNSGTILPDASALVQPAPNRLLLERRLVRIGRNTLRLAQLLDAARKGSASPISRVIYPGLPDHTAYRTMHKTAFYGGFFSCEFSSKHPLPFKREYFVKRIFAEAQKRDVPLVLGAGFGFSTTRVYILPAMAGVQEPLLRISAGTETLREIDLIADAIIAAMS